jgi:hypothetical protein
LLYWTGARNSIEDDAPPWWQTLGEAARFRAAVLQTVDASGCWRHIYVDQIIQSHTRPKDRAGVQTTRKLVLTGKYLLLPTKNVSCTPFNAHQPPPEAIQATMQILDVFVEGMPDYTPKTNKREWQGE